MRWIFIDFNPPGNWPDYTSLTYQYIYIYEYIKKGKSIPVTGREGP
jgi:hypothetical protein